MSDLKIKYSNRIRPSTAQVKKLYASAPWAKDRITNKITLALKHSPLLATAWQGKVLVGMARCSTDWAFRCVLWDVIVEPQLRAQGIGKQLVTLITNHPRLKKVEQVWLYTSKNEKFYSALGFKRETKGVMIRRNK